MPFCYRNRAAVAAALCFVGIDPAIAEDKEETEEVVVTGTNIRGLPQEYVASPVFTYSAREMEQSGLGSLTEYIQTIPQNFIGDLSEAATTGVGFGTGLEGAVSENQFDGFAAFSLRGLGSDATLTLLNGRRLPNAGMTETPTVSFIPAALIERIEVVPDGASATYGADAVGGVVNLVTRRKFDGLELQMRGSTATEVDRDEYQVSALAGHSWSSGNVFGGAALQDREPLVGDPVEVEGDEYQIAVTPDEALHSLFAGITQGLGDDVRLSLESSYFENDRSSFQLTLPDTNRRFHTHSDGYSLNSSLQWQAGRATSFDLALDYHENDTLSETHRGATRTSRRTYTNRLVYAEARGQTELFTLPAGPVQAAAGLQYRREVFRTDALIFFHQGGGEEEVSSLFAETYLPIVSAEQAVPFVRSLVLSLAGRYEDFGDPMGSKFAPKVGLRWSLTSELGIRSTYSRSFLTPKLRDRAGIAEQVSFSSELDAFLDPADQDPRLPNGQSLVLFRAGSNPDLVPQDADTFTAGFDYAPAAVEGLEIGLGYYHTKLTDRVATPFPFDILLVPQLQTFATRTPMPGEVVSVLTNPIVNRIFAAGVPFLDGGELVFFDSPSDVPADLIDDVQVIVDSRTQNFASELTEGIDLDLHYARQLIGGDASFRLRGQYILALERRTASGTEAISRLGTIFNPSDLTMTASLAWQRGPLSVSSVVNYVDGFTDTRDGQENARIGSYATASLSVGWTFGSGHRSPWLADSSVALVVANAFDQQPPRIRGEVLTFSPLNTPANPRTVSLIVRKRM